ncbi:MAG TPA: zf-TFIIB domain-containing protein [Thermodesulfobacteriota bacterium]|nr:zf-TFIIB domain-containing protein [Thermodesulfobacteriota bacterium]
MTKEKPSKTEDEYFAKEEAEKSKRLKEKIKHETEEEERERIKTTCYMKCPKCGGNLHEVSFRGISIDRCSTCGGVWLDNGELEKLAGAGDGSFISEVLSFFSGKK